MSDFLGLRIALSSLHAQRKALDVTGQNVANVNTDGYSRQRVNLSADSGPITPALHSTWTGSGMGVTSDGIDRLRDQFLELRGHQEHAALSGIRETQGVLARIELAFAEPSETGVAAQMADFWAGWDDIANHPDDVAARSQLVERATTLMAGFSQLDSTLDALSTSSTEQLKATVVDVNATASRVADLNKTIQGAVNAGFSPNDLIDQRDLLITDLANKVGATVRPGPVGIVDVFVGGTALVRGVRSENLQVEIGTAGAVQIQWQKDGYPANVSGETASMATAVNDVVVRYRTGLDAVRDQLVTAVNGIHNTGAPGDAADPTLGADFFVARPEGGFVVNPDIVADLDLIRAGAVGGGELDDSIARELALLGDDKVGADASYRKLIVQLGVESQSVNRRVEIQGSIVRQVDGARESAAGVNLDEEMANMIAFQHAYDASARFLTAIDSMLETLINGTGLVGRR